MSALVAPQITSPASRQTANLGDVVQFVGGGTPSKKQTDFWNGDIPWVSPKDMKSHIITDSIDRITPEAVNESSAKSIPAGAVLIVVRSGILSRTVPIALAGCKLTVNQDLKALVPNAVLSPHFLAYFLKSMESQLLASVSSSATVHRLSTETLKSLRIPLLPLDEQKRIVAVLDQAFAALDRARELIESNLSDTQSLKNRVRETELDSRGKNWAETTIGDICDRFEYGTSSKSAREGTVPVLRMGNLQGGEIDWNDLKYSNDASDIEKYSLNDGDVLFNRTNSIEHVGKTAIYRGEREAIFAGYLIRLHYKRDQVHPDYLNIFLNSDRAKAHGHSLMGKSVNQANISASKLKSYPIALPSLAEQQAIAKKTTSIGKLSEKVQNESKTKLANIDELRQSILNKAFAGELI